MENWNKICHTFWQFAENETISKYFTLKCSHLFFYHNVKILESKLGTHVFLVLCYTIPIQAYTIPRSVASLFEDMMCTCNHSAPVKRIFSQSGIIGVIKKLKNSLTKRQCSFLSFSKHSQQHCSVLLLYCEALHLRNISISNSSSDILARCGRIIMPLCENRRSTGAEVAGTQNKWRQVSYKIAVCQLIGQLSDVSWCDCQVSWTVLVSRQQDWDNDQDKIKTVKMLSRDKTVSWHFPSLNILASLGPSPESKTLSVVI